MNKPKTIFCDIDGTLIKHNGDIIKNYLNESVILDNVIETNDGFCLIDWRQDFAGDLEIGDVYYDLAKVYQSLIGYDNILNSIEIDDAYRSELVTYFESMFSKEVLDKVKLITASLLISMLPLHDDDETKFNKYIKLIKGLV